MLPIMTDVSHLLAMLRQQAADLGESRCHLLPDRVITYRRLWSRIERASARLQGEWGVQRGQTVAYVSCGHPDAIVLYGALLRIGAVFMPLESLPDSSTSALLTSSGATLAIVDEGLSLQDIPTHPLSLLLADWCHADPVVVDEDPSARALLLPERMAPVARAIKARGGLVCGSQFTLWPNAQGEPMISEHLKERRPFLRRGDFAPGSRGQAHVDVLAPLVDVSVSKVAYSAFFNTQLDWVLRHAGIDTLAVCGIVTNGGVASSDRKSVV